jgi:O-methyltransferase
MTSPNPQLEDTERVKRMVTGFDRLGAGTEFADYNALRFYNAKRAEWTLPRASLPLTLLSKAQLDLIEDLLIGIEARGIVGDCIEAGVWRGGAIIAIRAILDALGLNERQLIAADSFAGIPPSIKFQHDPVDLWPDRWVASLHEVKANIADAGMLDGRIEFLEGLFADTLPGLAGRRFSFIRLDSDSYDSVIESLESLYPLLNPGGVILVDDWHLFGCRLAIDTYRKDCGIVDPIKVLAGNGFWIKS